MEGQRIWRGTRRRDNFMVTAQNFEKYNIFDPPNYVTAVST